jgi:hypothetical protein
MFYFANYVIIYMYSNYITIILFLLNFGVVIKVMNKVYTISYFLATIELSPWRHDYPLHDRAVSKIKLNILYFLYKQMFWSDFLFFISRPYFTWNIFVLNLNRCLYEHWRTHNLFHNETVHFNAEFANWETPPQLHFKHN